MNNFLNLKGLLAASLIFFVSFSNAEDATSGTLEASVLDQSGTAIAGASVSVTSVDTGISKSATSNADGSVRFPLLAIGMYDVDVSASGYSSLADSVQVALGNSGYDFVLESAAGLPPSLPDPNLLPAPVHPTRPLSCSIKCRQTKCLRSSKFVLNFD